MRVRLLAADPIQQQPWQSRGMLKAKPLGLDRKWMFPLFLPNSLDSSNVCLNPSSYSSGGATLIVTIIIIAHRLMPTASVTPQAAYPVAVTMTEHTDVFAN
jgi:hypothetical protein